MQFINSISSYSVLRFDVDNARDDLNSQDYLGHCECVLADIVAAPERLLVLKLK